MKVRGMKVLAVALAMAVCGIGVVSAQQFKGTVKIIVPAAAGGTSDILARLISPHLQEALKVNVIVENKPGAGGNIGADAVAHAKKDGQTMFIYDMLSVLANPALFGSKLTYNLEKDLTGVSMVMFAQYIMAVNPSLPVKNTEELIAYSKANPGKIVYATSGNGALNHLTGLQLAKAWGVDWKFIHYKGGADAIRAVASNEAQMIINGATATQPFVVQNQMKGISVSGTSRLAALPDLPSWKELKYPVIDNGSWQGIMTTAGTDKKIIDRLNAELAKILSRPEITAKIKSLGGEVKTAPADDFNKWIGTNLVEMSKVIKEAGLKF
ncbi:MAG: tripartite tricarboxylate transporter substrate binding protein [Treponemataceae bacterium]